MNNLPLLMTLLCLVFVGLYATSETNAEENEDEGEVRPRVIVISIDGWTPEAVTSWGAENLPNFYRLRTEGAFTDNARTDYDFTETMPNHTGMITGRPAYGPDGHGYDFNTGTPETRIHTEGYLTSMFDVAHDHGLGTALYSGKAKFGVYWVNYGEELGAPDLIGEDNGRNKIDSFLVNPAEAELLEAFRTGMETNAWDLSLLHVRLPDYTGHFYDWNLNPESEYMKAILSVDAYLGEIFELIEMNAEFADNTYLIVTSDHGGTQLTLSHRDARRKTNYTIPFYVWGPGVKAGADLYALNPDFSDPRQERPSTDSLNLPIRNGMVGNLALQLIGLPAIPGSSLNLSQDFRVSDPPDFASLYPGLDPQGDDNGNGYSNFFDYAIGADPSGPSRPDLLPRMSGRDMVVSLRSNTSDLELQFDFGVNLVDWYPLPFHEGVTYRTLGIEETADGRDHRLELIQAFGGKTFYRTRLEP